MLMNKIGFLFDLDGVLIDSEKEYTRIWTTIGQLFPTQYEDFAIKIKGMTLTNILKTYYEDNINREAVRKQLYAMESEMRYEWLPGAKELLQELCDRGIPKALVTSSNQDKMAYLYRQIPELKNFFEAIITGDKVPRSKPDPVGYEIGAMEIGCRPHKCAVFEDSLQGVMAGERAGAMVIGVIGTLKEEVIAPHCNLCVSTLIDFPLERIIHYIATR